MSFILNIWTRFLSYLSLDIGFLILFKMLPTELSFLRPKSLHISLSFSPLNCLIKYQQFSFWDNSLATPVPSSGATGQADTHRRTRTNYLSYSLYLFSRSDDTILAERLARLKCLCGSVWVCG